MKKIIFADKFKTISDLCELNGRVYLELPNDAKGNEFMKRAEEEGFTFKDGVKPTERDYSRVMAINKDKTLNYLGAMGMMAYGSGCKWADSENGRIKIIRVLYETETGYEQKGKSK
jgi:hypothetical protein